MRFIRAIEAIDRGNHERSFCRNMPKTQPSPEVQILQFFEEAPLEKAETVFNIVSGKMRARLMSQSSSDEPPRPRSRRSPTPRVSEAQPEGVKSE